MINPKQTIDFVPAVSYGILINNLARLWRE